ncbi:MAG: endo-1,4-beta-xylanase [Chitinivibrionales bacterium]
MGRTKMLQPITSAALIGVLLCVFTSSGQIAQGANKHLGNITTSGRVRDDFMEYWNQITGENEHKWSSVEGTRDEMNWGGADAIADFARENNIPWKLHTLVWGSQYPQWMDELSTSEQREEIIEWYDACAARYPDVQMIDVVNEAYMSDPDDWNAGKHAPIPFREALGGTGTTGFDWIVEAFKMARERWPDAILIYNDYNTLEWPNEINWIQDIIPRLVAAGAPIDAVGFQAHGLKGTDAQTLQSRLDQIYNSIQLPMIISEYDIGENDDQAQLQNYQAHIPVMWNHPGVVGITIWGYILGATWVEGTGIKRQDGSERPALTWLKEYISDNLNPPNDYPDFLQGGGSSYRLAVSTQGQGNVTWSPDESSYEKDTQVTITATASQGWVFDSWGGDASGNQNPLTVTMDASKNITANFLTDEGKQDLVINGTFSAGTNSWSFNNWSGDGAGEVVDGEYQLTVNTAGDNYYDIQVVQSGITLEQEKTYKLVYDAYASDDRVLNVNVGMPEDPYTTFLSDVVGETEVNLSTTKQSYSLEFTMEEPTYEDSRVEFSVGLNTPTVYIDNVSLFEVEPSTGISSGKAYGAKNATLNVQQKGSIITVNLQNPMSGNAHLKVYDLRGSVVGSHSYKAQAGVSQNFSFSAESLPRGYYVVKVQSGKSVLKTGLMVTHK